MAFKAKFTAQRGKPELADVELTAGADEAQTDTMSINMDIDQMEKGDALMLLDNMRAKIHASPWPPETA